MDIHTNFKISIPKPCHEDWNKFTPDEKGAFCKVCSKSVHDFTKKSAEEIKIILVDEMNAGKKVCGRFNEDQITPVSMPIPSLSPYILNFTRMKKFAFALFLVFGGYLFNTTKSSAQKLMGKIAYVPRNDNTRKGLVIPNYIEELKKDTAKALKDSLVIQKKIGTCEGNMLKGDVFVEPLKELVRLRGAVEVIEELAEAIAGDTAKAGEPETDNPEIMGVMVALPYDYEKPITGDPIPVENDSSVIKELAVEESTFVEVIVAPSLKGEMQEDDSFLSQRDSPKESFVLFGAAVGQEDLSLSSYPNPSSSGQIMLRYNLKKDGMASISLFDLNGNLVKTLLPLQPHYASLYETRYDVSDLADGVYFCELISGQNKITVSIVIGK